MNNKKTFYVTTPIYYPSGSLHIGHVYTTTLAWVLKNYKTLNGFDAKFLTGADEHGQKIQEKAKALNLDPQLYVDEMTKKFKDLWTLLNIDYDYYSRTTDKSHMESVAKQFTQLLNQKDIFLGEYKGLYSVQDEEFLTPTQAVKKEDGFYYHPTSGHKLTEVSEESYFFEMSKYEKWLSEYIQSHPNFIIPEKITNELKSNFIDKGLENLSVSRSTFTWGIPIKENPKHVMYVWLDALNNYITALGYNSENDSDFKKYWENGDEIVHLVGKEITRFHCIYWPIILKAAGIKLPTTILSHGWIVTPEGKMSKSKGNVIDPVGLVEKYGAEVVKYFFASQISMGQDGIFDETILKNVFNADLANNYGNLLSRVLAMTAQNFEANIVKYSKTDIAEDIQIEKDILDATELYKKEFDAYQINKALNVATDLGKKLNKYVDVTMPWTLKEDKPRLEKVLNNLLNGLYAVSTMLSVVIPNKANEALKQLGQKEFSLDLIQDFTKFDNIKVIKENVLFERIK